MGASSATVNDSFVLFSGRGGLAMAPVEENGAVWRYSLTDNKWSKLAPDAGSPHPAGRSYHCMTSDDKQTVFMHAGCPENGRLSDLWSYNLTSNTWKELASAPDPPRGGTSVAFSGGKLYRMNGFDGIKEQGGNLDIYDIASDNWTSHKYTPNGVDGPTPRSVCALLAVRVQQKDHLITLFGEQDPSTLGHAGAGRMLNDVWAFDISGRKWSKVDTNSTEGNQPAPRGWFAADVHRGEESDEIVVHGGLAEDNKRLGDFWILSFLV